MQENIERGSTFDSVGRIRFENKAEVLTAEQIAEQERLKSKKQKQKTSIKIILIAVIIVAVLTVVGVIIANIIRRSYENSIISEHETEEIFDMASSLFNDPSAHYTIEEINSMLARIEERNRQSTDFNYVPLLLGKMQLIVNNDVSLDEFAGAYEKVLQFGNDNQRWDAHGSAIAFFSDRMDNQRVLEALYGRLAMLEDGFVEFDYGIEGIQSLIEAIKSFIEEENNANN